MSLTEEERKSIVAYRIEKANQVFEEARKTFDIALYNLTANRLYYSVYYSATALLLDMEQSSHTHRGAMTLFNLHIVKHEIMTKEEGALFRQLFGMRHEGDYEDFIDFSREDVEPFFPLVSSFITKVESLLLDKPS